MNDKNDVPSNWTSLYELAMVEVDYAKLPQRIMETRNAIAVARSTSRPSSGVEELRSMQDALQNLRILEEELRDSRPEEKQHIHFELDGEYVAMVDPFRRYVAVSDAVCRLLSFSRQELLTKKIDDVTAPNMRHSVPETFRKYVDIGFMTGTHQLMRRDGTLVTIRYEAKVFPDGCLVARWHPE